MHSVFCIQLYVVFNGTLYSTVFCIQPNCSLYALSLLLLLLLSMLAIDDYPRASAREFDNNCMSSTHWRSIP